jgi:hypothetical protein
VRKGLKNLDLNASLSSNNGVRRSSILLGLSQKGLDSLGGEILRSKSLNNVDGKVRTLRNGSKTTRNKELLGRTGRLNHLNKTRAELLDGGNVISKDTEVTSGRGNVDLDTTENNNVSK